MVRYEIVDRENRIGEKSSVERHDISELESILKSIDLEIENQKQLELDAQRKISELVERRKEIAIDYEAYANIEKEQREQAELENSQTIEEQQEEYPSEQ